MDMNGSFLSRLKRRAVVLHRDEQGATMLEYMLIVAAIALPLLGVLIWFWKDISAWVGEAYEDVKAGEGTDPDDLD